MSFENLIIDEARKLKINISDDVVPMFILAFSKLGKIDEYLGEALDKVSQGKTPEDANKARLIYIIDDILELANNGARDANFDFVDAYMILLVIVNDASYINYLNHDFIKIRPITPYKLENVPANKIQYPAYSGLINSYLYAGRMQGLKGMSQLSEQLYNHFNNSNIQVLNLTNVYDEILRLSNQGK